jgi:hypothetical protein
VETQLPSHRTRANKVRPAERRQEVVKRFFVGDVNDRHASAPPVTIAVEQVVVAHRNEAVTLPVGVVTPSPTLS